MGVAETVQLTIGAEAECSDGACGEIRGIVLVPATRAVSHLVVEPKGRQGLGRLVPVDLVEAVDSVLRLRCTKAEFEKLDHAEETEFLPASGGHEDYPIGVDLPQPYDGLGDVIGDVPQPVTRETIPDGDVEIGRGRHVHATDGPIGTIRGFVVGSSDHRVMQVLLEEGHLWGHKDVAIPISAVATVDDGIRLNVAKHEVQDLPSVDLDR